MHWRTCRPKGQPHLVLWMLMISIVACSVTEQCYARESSLIRFVDLHIAEQPLDTALIEFSRQSGIPLSIATNSAGLAQAPALTGSMQASVALAKLLHESGLQYVEVRNTIVVLQKLSSSTAFPVHVDGTDQVTADSSINSARSDIAVPSGETQHLSQNTQSTAGIRDLAEVVVTAQKRSELLQEVPVPVTAISADALADSNLVRLQDFYTSVPGLSVSPAGQSTTTIAIRGISTGFGVNPTVGITIDDVPFGSSTANGGGQIVPDIDPADLARIEILRGPQGALYGASALGGLIKYVTADPSTENVNARVEGGLLGVQNGAQLGYNARASVNAPLTDTLGIRASGFARLDPGYIDNPVTNVDGVNKARVNGGRLAALWRPTDALSVKVSALIQDSRGDGSNDVNVQPNLGDLQQNYPRGVGSYSRKVQAYGAILTGKFWNFDFTAVSGYNISSFHDSSDLSFALGPYTDIQFGTPLTANTDNSRLSKFSQEIRLSASIGQRFDWLLGLFYTYESSKYFFTAPALLASGEQVGNWYYINFPSTYREEALFTDLTFHFTDRFDVQVGGRGSHIRQTNSESVEGQYAPVILGVPSPVVYPEVETRSNAFTYLITPRFKLSSDLMAYARLASGYRPGGPNAVPGVPREFNPDRVQNYEIGVKGDYLHMLAFDTSFYYINWKDIQIGLVDPTSFQGYQANASRAESKGVDLTVELRPLRNLKIIAWAAWNQATLTRGFPAASTDVGGAYGVAGDPLPYTSRFSSYVSLEQSFPLTGNLTAVVAASVSYVGKREAEFTGTPQRTDLPAYARTDLRIGATYESWTANFFVNNLSDKRGLLAGGEGYSPPDALVYILPRSIGLSVTKTF